MKKTLLAASVFALAMGSASFAAGTSQGDIRFTGEVTNASCTLEASTPLDLGSVSTKTLAAAEDTSRIAQTTLRFRDCAFEDGELSQIAISFDSSAADATMPALYKNQGSATNVGVKLWFDGQLLNPDGSTEIDVRQVGAAGGDVTFVVQGQMVATAAGVQPGTVDGVVGFTAEYK